MKFVFTFLKKEEMTLYVLQVMYEVRNCVPHVDMRYNVQNVNMRSVSFLCSLSSTYNARPDIGSVLKTSPVGEANLKTLIV
jgi:hypothetical protein